MGSNFCCTDVGNFGVSYTRISRACVAVVV